MKRFESIVKEEDIENTSDDQYCDVGEVGDEETVLGSHLSQEHNNLVIFNYKGSN